MIDETCERAVLIGELFMYPTKCFFCSKQVQLKAITQWKSTYKDNVELVQQNRIIAISICGVGKLFTAFFNLLWLHNDSVLIVTIEFLILTPMTPKILSKHEGAVRLWPTKTFVNQEYSSDQINHRLFHSIDRIRNKIAQSGTIWVLYVYNVHAIFTRTINNDLRHELEFLSLFNIDVWMS